MRWLALGGIAGPVLFAAMTVVCGAIRPGYSHSAQFISELGATGTSNAALMNLGGFIPAGALIGLFAVSLARVLPNDRTSICVAVLVGVFGLGLILAGSIPCAPGCPQDEATLHDGISVAAFLCAIAGIALSAHRFRSLPAWRDLRPICALASGAGLGFLVMLALSLDARALTGFWQRMLVGTLFLWCAVAGVRAFRLGASPRAAG